MALDGNGNEALVGAPVVSPTPPYPGAVWFYERVGGVIYDPGEGAAWLYQVS